VTDTERVCDGNFEGGIVFEIREVKGPMFVVGDQNLHANTEEMSQWNDTLQKFEMCQKCMEKTRKGARPRRSSGN
jgi:hypothetical protein